MMRLLPIANLSLAVLLVAVPLLAVSTIGATAATQTPDSIPYPTETTSPAPAPAVKPAAKPAAKTTIKPLAKPAAKPDIKATVKPASKKPTPPHAIVALPPPKPEALKPDALKPAGKDTAKAPPKSVVAKAATSKAIATPSSPPPDVFAGIGRNERQKLQAALLWSADDPGAANSSDPMLEAVKNFQKRIKAKITGQLTADERTKLLAAARDHEQEFGWTVVTDPATGIRIGLPLKMVPQVHEASHGTRWSSRHGEIQVETFRLDEPGLKLSELFAREKKQPATRRVESSALHDDDFFISGLQGLRKFSVRATMRNGEVRGFTMTFDQAMEGIVAPVMAAMTSAFSPFPQRGAPFADLSRPVEYGNGLIVSTQGHIVSDARLTQGCQVIVAAGFGDVERIASDSDTGLALLRIYRPNTFKPAALPREAKTEKSGNKPIDVTLAGIPDPKEHDGGGKLGEIKAWLTDGNAIELRQPVPMAGFTGAAALDRDGHLLGMTEMRPAVLASNAPAAPPVRLVTTDAIRAFLDAQHIPPPATHSDAARDSIVRVICVRK
jgi:hypothetical protein